MPVRDIVDAALAAWSAQGVGSGAGQDAQVTLACRADLVVANKQSAALAMLTYELATNAVKYGALSTEDGHLTVTLEETEEGGVLRWIERAPSLDRDGQADVGAGAPDADGRGFGSILMTHCEKMLRGCVVRRLTPTGLHLEAFFPVVRSKEAVMRRAARDMANATAPMGTEVQQTG